MNRILSQFVRVDEAMADSEQAKVEGKEAFFDMPVEAEKDSQDSQLDPKEPR